MAIGQVAAREVVEMAELSERGWLVGIRRVDGALGGEVD